MRKVKIITFHPGLNYGAVLQAFALMKFIKQLNFDVEVIDYRPYKLMKKYYRFLVRPVLLISRIKQLYNFSRFRKQCLIQTKQRFRNLQQLKNASLNADYLICGSDQIWNSLVFGEIDFAYLLAFAKDSQKRIAYAASLGANHFPQEYKGLIKTELAKFNRISVREKFAQNEVLRFTGKSPQIVLDPTLLLENYDEIAIKPKELPAKYILVYGIEFSGFLKNIAQITKERLQIPIVNISSWHYKEADTNATGITPTVWLGWFQNADYVVTNSFHGTAFSIIFNKNFSFSSIEAHKGLNNRISDLLETLDISERMIEINNEQTAIKNLQNPIDYKKVNKKLSLVRKNSIEFLKSALDLID